MHRLRRTARPGAACALLAVAIAASCGGGADGGGAEGDGGWSRSESGLRIGCTLGGQDCPAGSTCDFFCDGAGAKIACRSVPSGGGVAAGGTCTSSEMCGATTGCFATASMAQSCVRYCSGDGDCAQGTCQDRTVQRYCPAGRGTHLARFCLP